MRSEAVRRSAGRVGVSVAAVAISAGATRTVMARVWLSSRRMLAGDPLLDNDHDPALPRAWTFKSLRAETPSRLCGREGQRGGSTALVWGSRRNPCRI